MTTPYRTPAPLPPDAAYLSRALARAAAVYAATHTACAAFLGGLLALDVVTGRAWSVRVLHATLLALAGGSAVRFARELARRVAPEGRS